MNRNQKIYLDRRVTTTGKKSHIHLDNSVRLGLLPPGGLSGQVLTKLTDEDYDVYWEDVTNLINITINPIVVAGARFVMTNGNNATAQPQMLHLPWSDPFTAANALGGMNPDETVIVYPGFYNVTLNPGDQLLNSGNLHLMEGAVLQVNVSNSASSALIGGNMITGEGLLNIVSTDPFPRRTLVSLGLDLRVENVSLTRVILEPLLNSSLDVDRLELLSSTLRFNWRLQGSQSSNNISTEYYVRIGDLDSRHMGTPGVNMFPSQLFEFNPLQGPNQDPNVNLQVPQVLTIDIGNIRYSKGDGLNGLFLFRQTTTFGAEQDYIKIRITSARNPLIRGNQESGMTDAIITFDNWNGNIDFKLNHWVGNHIWVTRQGTGVTGAKGTIDITGKLLNRANTSYPMHHGLIDMRANPDNLVYKVDLVNYNSKWPTLFNISGSENSKLTGRILDVANVDGVGPYQEGVIVFGSTTNLPGLASVGVSIPALMSDLAIITNAGQNCFDINNVLQSGTEIPVYNVRSNSQFNPANNPVFVIQPNITVHPAIKS